VDGEFDDQIHGSVVGVGFEALEPNLEIVDAAGFELFGAVDPWTRTALIVTPSSTPMLVPGCSLAPSTNRAPSSRAPVSTA